MSGAIQLAPLDPPADTQTGCACTFYLVFKEPILLGNPSAHAFANALDHLGAPRPVRQDRV